MHKYKKEDLIKLIELTEKKIITEEQLDDLLYPHHYEYIEYIIEYITDDKNSESTPVVLTSYLDSKDKNYMNDLTMFIDDELILNLSQQQIIDIINDNDYKDTLNELALLYSIDEIYQSKNREQLVETIGYNKSDLVRDYKENPIWKESNFDTWLECAEVWDEPTYENFGQYQQYSNFIINNKEELKENHCIYISLQNYIRKVIPGHNFNSLLKSIENLLTKDKVSVIEQALKERNIECLSEDNVNTIIDYSFAINRVNPNNKDDKYIFDEILNSFDDNVSIAATVLKYSEFNPETDRPIIKRLLSLKDQTKMEIEEYIEGENKQLFNDLEYLDVLDNTYPENIELELAKKAHELNIHNCWLNNSYREYSNDYAEQSLLSKISSAIDKGTLSEMKQELIGSLKETENNKNSYKKEIN